MTILCELGLWSRILADKPEFHRITCQTEGVIFNPVLEAR